MEKSNNEETLDKFLQKLEEVAKADCVKLLSSEILNDIGAIKYLNRDLHANNISYGNELLQLSVQYKKDFKQLLDDIMHDVWIKERLRQLTSKLKDETLKRQLLEQIDTASTNFLFVTSELGTRSELEKVEREYAGKVFMLNY